MPFLTYIDVPFLRKNIFTCLSPPQMDAITCFDHPCLSSLFLSNSAIGIVKWDDCKCMPYSRDTLRFYNYDFTTSINLLIFLTVKWFTFTNKTENKKSSYFLIKVSTVPSKNLFLELPVCSLYLVIQVTMI